MLMHNAYADERAMLLRKEIHERYSMPSIHMPTWVLDRHQWRGDERVLDLGCGPGAYYEDIVARIPRENYWAGDLSIGMLYAFDREYGTHQPKLMQFDAAHLPFADEAFDVVVASHVLHHVIELESAIEEMQRVLKRPTGVLIASASSEYTMPEFNTLMQRAVRLLRNTPQQEMHDPFWGSDFSLERGAAHLARRFRSVARYDYPNVFIFKETRPIIEYIESSRPFYEVQLPEGVDWDEFMTIMADQVRRLVEHFGELAVNKLTGVVIATDEGGFAQEYQQYLSRYRTP
ncbi:MAG: class I SAM-dependent methyltransferase [Anaerolineales bacterium]